MARSKSNKTLFSTGELLFSLVSLNFKTCWIWLVISHQEIMHVPRSITCLLGLMVKSAALGSQLNNALTSKLVNKLEYSYSFNVQVRIIMTNNIIINAILVEIQIR